MELGLTPSWHLSAFTKQEATRGSSIQGSYWVFIVLVRMVKSLAMGPELILQLAPLPGGCTDSLWLEAPTL